MAALPTAHNPEKLDLEKQQLGHEANEDHDSSSKTSLDQHGGAPEAPTPPPNPWMDPSSFPDGGAEAWLTVAASSACFFVTWGWINCIGVFQDYFIREPLREYSPSTVAWIPSVETFLMLFLGIFAGWVFDRWGPRHILAIGSFLHVFGLMMASISTEYYQFMLSQGVCSAIGASLIFTPAVTCVSTWFFKKRGMAIGLAAAGSSLGGVLFPIIVSRMIDEVGFGWAMRTCAFLILGLSTLPAGNGQVSLADTKQ
jgi:MFS family permease